MSFVYYFYIAFEPKHYCLIMKRIIFTFLFLASCVCMFSQVISKKELEKYTDLGGMSWTEKALELSKTYNLNEKGELQLSVIGEYEGQTKSELYKKILNWIISMSTEAESALQIADEEKGQIITRCYLPNIAKRTMGDNSYRVSIRPLLTFDFKDGKVRFTYTLQCYDVLKKNDDSGYVMMFGSFGITGSGVTKDNQIWQLVDCYPFINSKNQRTTDSEDDDVYTVTRNSSRSKHPKVTSSRAFVTSISCYNILVDKIDEVLLKPSVDNNDDW